MDIPTFGPLPPQAALYESETQSVVPSGGGTIDANDIEFDYSTHLSRIIAALESLAVSNAIIANGITTIAEKQTVIAEKQTVIAEKQTVIAEKQTVIAAETVTMDNHLDRLQSTVYDMDLPCGSSGPHVRNAGTTSCIDDYWLTRALAIYNMRVTGIMEEIRREIRNPTPFP